MISALAWLARRGTLVLPLAVAIGLVVQPLASFMRPALAPVVFFMLAVILTRLDIAGAADHVRAPGLLVLALGWAIVATPLIFAGVLHFARPGAGLELALIMWASSPPIFASAALAYILGLRGALSTLLLIAAIGLHPVITPVFIALFASGSITVSGPELALRLGALVGGALVMSLVARKVIGARRSARVNSALDGLNVLAMIIFAIALMDGIPERMAARPAFAIGLTLFVFALSAIMHIITTVLFWKAGARTAVTYGFAMCNRNIAIAIGALSGLVPDDTWLFFALIQFPIYSLPALLKPVYRRLLADDVHPGGA